VPCDVVAYHERADRQEVRDVVWIGEPLGPVTPEIREADRRWWHQDLLIQADGARTYSDFWTQREFHRTELYQETARPLGVEYMMRLWIGALVEGGAALEFDRSTTDFSERDRKVLDLLQPHLRQFRVNAARRQARAAAAAPGDERLTPREREILELVADGRTNAEVAQLLWVSPSTVRKHLENAYAKLGVHTRGRERSPPCGRDPARGLTWNRGRCGDG